MKAIIAIIAVLLLLAAGCVQEQGLLGNDTDSHGCKGSAGYTWCELKQKCIRLWEETCIPPLVGNDTDAHGCIPSAGYSWCDAKQKCIRSWEENCTVAPSIEEQASLFCGNENVAAVFICGDHVRVVSSLLGGGSTFYKDGQEVASCPVVGPDAESDQCRLLLHGSNCVEQEISCNMPGSDRDSHGCIPSAGYSWCDAKQKCVREWEEPCEGTLTLDEARAIARNSTCMLQSDINDEYFYNSVTKTWWLGMKIYHPGCNPACVVEEQTRKAAINWRCTGVNP